MSGWASADEAELLLLLLHMVVASALRHFPKPFAKSQCVRKHVVKWKSCLCRTMHWCSDGDHILLLLLLLLLLIVQIIINSLVRIIGKNTRAHCVLYALRFRLLPFHHIDALCALYLSFQWMWMKSFCRINNIIIRSIVQIYSDRDSADQSPSIARARSRPLFCGKCYCMQLNCLCARAMWAPAAGFAERKRHTHKQHTTPAPLASRLRQVFINFNCPHSVSMRCESPPLRHCSTCNAP